MKKNLKAKKRTKLSKTHLLVTMDVGEVLKTLIKKSKPRKSKISYIPFVPISRA